MPSTRSSWRGPSGWRLSASARPRTAFSGVRTSWLVTARKADLARLEASAACRCASASATSRCSLAFLAFSRVSCRSRSTARPSCAPTWPISASSFSSGSCGSGVKNSSTAATSRRTSTGKASAVHSPASIAADARGNAASCSSRPIQAGAPDCSTRPGSPSPGANERDSDARRNAVRPARSAPRQIEVGAITGPDRERRVRNTWPTGQPVRLQTSSRVRAMASRLVFDWLAALAMVFTSLRSRCRSHSSRRPFSAIASASRRAARSRSSRRCSRSRSASACTQAARAWAPVQRITRWHSWSPWATQTGWLIAMVSPYQSAAPSMKPSARAHIRREER